MKFKILLRFTPTLPIALEVGRRKAEAALIVEFCYPVKKSAKAPLYPPSKAPERAQPIS
jgi:hypothetical protein